MARRRGTHRRKSLRLWVPYVVGDLYGAPNAGELAPVTFKPDMSFVLDLNRSHRELAKALIPTEFSQKWMTIEPATARIARLSPFVLPADGIVPVGVAEWLDADTGTKLMLVYLDRPARLRGEIVHEGRNLRFDIDGDRGRLPVDPAARRQRHLSQSDLAGAGSPCGNAQ